MTPLFSMTHLPERHHGLWPHHLIHRQRSEKQKSGGDHDTDIGGEPRQHRTQPVTDVVIAHDLILFSQTVADLSSEIHGTLGTLREETLAALKQPHGLKRFALGSRSRQNKQVLR
jgi:hypothetical protein